MQPTQPTDIFEEGIFGFGDKSDSFPKNPTPEQMKNAPSMEADLESGYVQQIMELLNQTVKTDETQYRAFNIMVKVLKRWKNSDDPQNVVLKDLFKKVLEP